MGYSQSLLSLQNWKGIHRDVAAIIHLPKIIKLLIVVAYNRAYPIKFSFYWLM